MWSCVTHCAGACLRWSYCEFMNCPPRPRLVPQISSNAHGFIVYSPNFMYENKGFLSNVVGDFKEQTIILCVCCLSLLFSLPFSLSLFCFCTKVEHEKLCLLCPPTPPCLRW